MGHTLEQLWRGSLLAAGLLAATALVACQDYDLDPTNWPDPPEDPPEDPTPPEDPPEDPPEIDWESTPDAEDPGLDIPEEDPEEDPEDDPEEDPEEDPELPPCDETIEADWQWWGSMPSNDAADLTDGNGVAYFDYGFQMVDFSTVAIPDSGHVPSGHDRFYRATFWLDQLPPTLMLSMQSDDGMWFYLNGQLVGQWGGGWQQEGCVNDNAGCSQSVTVPAVDVTQYLVLGENVAAARVSNAVDNSYFEVYTECID